MTQQVNYKPSNMFLLFLSSCFPYRFEQQLTATVQDPWEHNISNATVKIPEYDLEILTKEGTAVLSEKNLFSKGYNEIKIM